MKITIINFTDNSLQIYEDEISKKKKKALAKRAFKKSRSGILKVGKSKRAKMRPVRKHNKSPSRAPYKKRKTSRKV